MKQVINGQTFQVAQIKYPKKNDKGLIKKVTETYMVDALSATECEARIIEKLGPVALNEGITVKSISAKTYESVAFSVDPDDSWWQVTVETKVEGARGKMKKQLSAMMVQSDEAQSALQEAENLLSGSMNDTRIVRVVETKVVEVWAYEKSAPAGFKKVEGGEEQ